MPVVTYLNISGDIPMRFLLLVAFLAGPALAAPPAVHFGKSNRSLQELTKDPPAVAPPDTTADKPPGVWSHVDGSRNWKSTAGYIAVEGQLSGFRLYVLRVGVLVPVGREPFPDLQAASRAAVEHYWDTKPDYAPPKPKRRGPPTYIECGVPGLYLDPDGPPTLPF